ncbi:MULTISPECIES: SDR family oxidoreductase [unclassified Nocardioides]|uniref:SDR family oxidoreductase n=1 Tax=unclassified Nocardioides TaxID=2615069 RepID=UPI000056FF9A|nr:MULTISPECIES: SDR family oxidoreductase [unclassified Nocardioides]ABL83617.1 short-chain dehydrogenase/reductase SDR [Nocardioides sp. JS614]
MHGICDGRVVIVTGAGRGLGRAHALEFARQGARVVVNDTGGGVDGTGGDRAVADIVVDEIRAMGGQAVANYADAADWEGSATLVSDALHAFGRLDTLVNNAGILRDRMFVNMTVEEWDDAIRGHLRTTFACSKHAVAHWRAESQAGRDVDARIINTSSPSGLYGNVGQSNYGAAKAGIAAFTIITATELARYGITVNAIAPGARTRMTENLAVLDGAATAADHGFDEMAPENVSPLVVYLGSSRSARITGRVFNVWGGRVSVAEGWVAGPGEDQGGRWTVDELEVVLPTLVGQAASNADTWGVRTESSLA